MSHCGFGGSDLLFLYMCVSAGEAVAGCGQRCQMPLGLELYRVQVKIFLDL